MLAVICQHFASYDLMNYSAEYLPDKGSLLRDFHDLLDELGFSFSNDAFYEVMTGAHSVYLKDEDETAEEILSNEADIDADSTGEDDDSSNFEEQEDTED